MTTHVYTHTQARLPTDIALGTPKPPLTTVTQYADHLRESLDFAYECVRERMGHQLEKQKTQYDTTVHGHPFQVGDLVWLHNPAVPRGRSKKFHRPWNGPYQVVARLSESVYRLKHLRRARCCPVVHFDCLKLCHKDIRPPKHQGKWRVSCGWMYTCIVGETETA